MLFAMAGRSLAPPLLPVVGRSCCCKELLSSCYCEEMMPLSSSIVVIDHNDPNIGGFVDYVGLAVHLSFTWSISVLGFLLEGCVNKGLADCGVMYILPQPTVENKRILLADGSMISWGIRERKAVFTVCSSGNTSHLSSQEAKRVTSACWICPFGTKVGCGI